MVCLKRTPPFLSAAFAFLSVTKQIIYVNLPKKDYIQPAAESIVIEKDESIFDKILNALKDIF